VLDHGSHNALILTKVFDGLKYQMLLRYLPTTLHFQSIRGYDLFYRGYEFAKEHNFQRIVMKTLRRDLHFDYDTTLARVRGPPPRSNTVMCMK